MPVLKAKPEHEVAYQDLCKLVNKHAGSVSAMELLAIAGNMIGKMIAMQDQRTCTPDMAIQIVVHNLEYGNQCVLVDLLEKTKGSA